MSSLTARAATSLFSIHGTGVAYWAGAACLVDPALGLLWHFRRTVLDDPYPLRLVFEGVEHRAGVPVGVPQGSRVLSSAAGRAMRDSTSDTWHCRVVEDQGRLIADFAEDGCIVIDRTRGIAEGWLVRPERMPAQMIEWYLHFALGELVKQRGLYAVHATALEKNGRGVLIPGYSGRGKTTAFLSLLRAGFRYLSDDTPRLRVTGAGVEVLSFPMKVDVTERTIDVFPELRAAPSGVLRQGLYKKYFHVEEVYSSGIGNSCRPAVILFPRVIDAPASSLDPLPKGDALRAILPQALVVHGPEIARREFHALSTLVQMADCYTLQFGQDILDLPNLITPLLEQVGV